MKLNISETVKKYRRQKDMTQEQLASVFGVSAQSVSKWECGDGYPDITLLPSIANYFGITVDELLGTDKQSAEDEIALFTIRYNKLHGKPEDQLEFALETFRKYPNEFEAARCAAHNIVYDLKGETRKEYLPVLAHLAERVMSDCNDLFERRRMSEYMFLTSENEEERQKWLKHLPWDYGNCAGEMMEERAWLDGDREVSRCIHKANDLSLMLHYLCRNSRYVGKPDMSIELNVNRERMLKHLCGGEILPAWQGLYGLILLRIAAASFALKRKEEGYAAIEAALVAYSMWFSIPTDTPLELGREFKDLRLVRLIEDGYMNVELRMADGTPYLCFGLFNFNPQREEVYLMMTAQKGWEWFNGVRNEPRFIELTEKAKNM